MDVGWSSGAVLDSTAEDGMGVAVSSPNGVLDSAVEDSTGVASSSSNAILGAIVDDGSDLDSPGASDVLNSSGKSNVDVKTGTFNEVLGFTVVWGLSISVDDSVEVILLTSVVAGNRRLAGVVNTSVRKTTLKSSYCWLYH